MAPAVSLLSNILNVQPGAPTRRQVRLLQTAATLDGQVDPAEREVLAKLPQLHDWLKKPTNPELALMRARDPNFDARVKALVANAKPGDLVFWQDGAGSTLSKYVGEWSHASLMLPGGKLLDTMTLEGASIATPEAVLAKTARRMHAGQIAIARPKTPLTPAQLQKLGELAEELQGRDYALISPLNDARANVSCSRSVYDVLKGAGVDVAPVEARVFKNAVMPGDLIAGTKAVGVIGTDGVFRAGLGATAWRPNALVRAIGRVGDFLVSHFPFVWDLVARMQTAATRRMRLG